MTDESKLIEDLRRKDSAAYRRVLNDFGSSLFNVAFRILRDREKAYEAVQEALLKMVQSIDRFEGRSSLKTWLYRITVNEALMAQRKELPRLDNPIDELMPSYVTEHLKTPLPDWATDPETVAANHEFQEFYHQTIEELPESLRTTYMLKDVEGLSEQEICEVLGLTKAAVKNRAHRARLILRQKIGERYGH